MRQCKSKKTFMILGLAIFAMPFYCYADSWEPLTERTFSSGTGYTFRVIPDSKYQSRYGYCFGELLEIKDGVQAKLWSRYLINNSGPVDVFVSPTGKHIITLDEWGSMGELPVVIYGPKGKLLQVDTLESLKIPPQGRTTRSMSGIMWKNNTITFFDTDGKYFFIRFPWKQVLIFDLERGGRLRGKNDFQEKEWMRLQSLISKKTEDLALAMLNSKYPPNRKTGAIALGQLGCKKAVPKLKELLKDSNFVVNTGIDKKSTTVFYVREAAQKALDLIGERN